MRVPALIAACALLATTLTLSAQQAMVPGVPVPVPATPPVKSAAGTMPPSTPAEPAKSAPAAASPPMPAPAAPPAKAAKPAKGPPARDLFGAAKTPSPLAARAIGFYAKGCLAGGKPLPVDGPAWQAMRLSRNRNWGHPELIDLVKRLATEARAQDGWPGLLVGDLAQPRGGPMTSGHASHQVGLDADIWLTPMPDRRLSEREREDMSAVSMLKSHESVDPEIWSEKHAKLIKRAASYAEVDRIFVHPAIKKALCEATPKDANRAWLSKVRPMYGHNFHFHIRIQCPKGSGNCEPQPAVGHEDGCGVELTKWLALVKPKAPVPAPPGPRPPPPRGKPPISIDELPADCRSVLASGPDGVVVPPPAKAAAKPHKTAASKTSAKK
ncbi:MAG: penicillin-insensitive murein endopeptidase [Hyphomicrobiaceae bacterium]|nr:penicillin-insensitive murein endopeptidase [Hyphomicrobiaceae bacterium]